MKPALTATITILLLSALLAGCIGGDDLPEEPGGEVGSGGTVTGTIFTVHLEPVANAPVQLVKDNDLVAEATTGTDGTYRIENVEPGEYRIQVNAVCCRENVRMVTVVEGETVTVDLQLEIFSEDDLQVPRVERYEWRGFLACTLRFLNPEGPHHGENVMGIPLGVSGVNVCGLVDIAADILTGENVTDDDFLHTFEIGPGLKTIVGGMDWQAPGAALGDELSVTVEVDGRPNLAPRYAASAGQAPVEFRADAGYVIENYDEEDDEGTNIHQYDFENIEESLDLMFRIFAAGDANVVYQQQFTMYWDLYYWEEAPETASSLPDR